MNRPGSMLLPLIAAIAVIALLTSALLLAGSSWQGYISIGVTTAIIIWVAVGRSTDALPLIYIFIATALLIAAVLPRVAAAPIELLALAGPFALWLRTPAGSRRGTAVVSLSAAIVALWFLLMFHPNVPDLTTGLLGFRKSVLAVAGIPLGCAIRQQHRASAEKTLIALLIGGLALSLVGYFALPSISQLVSRSADEYTASISGRIRLQGIFAGPFHVAMAGVLLVGWALVRIRQSPVLGLIAFAVGALATYFTYVRTAYIALAFVIIVFVAQAPGARATAKRLLATIVVAVSAVALALASSPSLVNTVQSISSFQTDNRFLNRLPEYQEGLRLFVESPIIGQGAGSAGDTLGGAFPAGGHVTPHNLVLKILVEGGLIGLLLWVALAIAIFKSIHLRTGRGGVAVTALVTMFGMGLTGSAIEAIPITFYVFTLVGLAVSNRRHNPHEGNLQLIEGRGRRRPAGFQA